MSDEAAIVIRYVPDLEDYPLPAEVRSYLLSLAAECDILLFGELHGTREVPRLIASLLPDLFALGYRGLALEIPSDQRQQIDLWRRAMASIPRFFATPSGDGRGNAEVLALIRDAGRAWAMLCVDAAEGEPCSAWHERDASMARNLAKQRRQFCPEGKVVGICGNMHSRLENRFPADHPMFGLWPSFAAALRDLDPQLSVRSVNIRFREGTFYNVNVRTVAPPSEAPLPPCIEESGEMGHTCDLVLPRCTPASFLAPPKPYPQQGD